jgi:flagellar basal body-associated protein FliL
MAIESIGDSIILVAIAVLGVLFYMGLGFLGAKQKNPELKFDVRYVYVTMFTAFTVALLYSEPVEVVTVSMIFQAFLVGFGGNGAVTKVAQISPTPGQDLIKKGEN